ncbi:MAG: glycosyltransferase [Desulfuromonadaceae bacterium]|nr:glycosyltransferase [Desulfuromonadaceae bacterium]MDD5106393.1 glycosyltransferase [Desulfuromonadaceae bacterium]
MTDDTIKISAVLCTINEDRYLEECLRSLAWANEIIVCDMGSTDRTVAIAQESGCTIHSVTRVPYVEMLRTQAVSYCKYDWICFVDPDFILPDGFADIVQRELIPGQDISCLYMAYINHYKNRPIRHGRWGTVGYYPIIFHKEMISILPVLHGGFEINRGTQRFLPPEEYIRHMWVRDEEHFYQKHSRYISHEGERRVALGWKPSVLRQVASVLKLLYVYITDGYKDGAIGFDLMKKSIWYEWNAEQVLAESNTSYRKTS